MRASPTSMVPAVQAVKNDWIPRICCPVRRWIPLHTVFWPARKQFGHLIRCPLSLKLKQKSKNQFEHPCQGQQADDKDNRNNPQNNFHFLFPSLIRHVSCRQYRQEYLSCRFTHVLTGQKFINPALYLLSETAIATPNFILPLCSFYTPLLAKIYAARQASIVMRLE